MEFYYRNELVTVYKGDCLEVMPQLDMTFDCCITDPPYGTTACKWDSVIPFEPMWKELKRLVKSNGAICLFGSEPFSSKLRMSNLPMFKYDWVWEKGKASNFLNARVNPLKVHELISVFNSHIYYPQKTAGKKYFKKMVKGSSSEYVGNIKNPLFRHPNHGDRFPRSIQYFPTAECEHKPTLHGTQKPVALIEYLVKTYTLEGELVLDFTAGSGTTGVACMRTGRRGVLIEREEKYCEIIANRLEHWQDESPAKPKRKKAAEVMGQMEFGF